MKKKVSAGPQGVVTDINEYELNLVLALKLQAELEDRGYEVLMIRTSHDVNISNIQRATMANEVNADAFIRIHANGSDNHDKQGAYTLCPQKNNPYNPEIYKDSKALATSVLDELAIATGCTKLKIWETDTMTGLNWSKVPVTLVEVGYMTNPEEDVLLSKDSYRNKITEGIANGIDLYFENKDAK